MSSLRCCCLSVWPCECSQRSSSTAKRTRLSAIVRGLRGGVWCGFVLAAALPQRQQGAPPPCEARQPEMPEAAASCRLPASVPPCLLIMRGCCAMGMRTAACTVPAARAQTCECVVRFTQMLQLRIYVEMFDWATPALIHWTVPAKGPGSTNAAARVASKARAQHALV